MITVCFHGAESTGKSVLANKLSREMGATWVPEYGRTYCEERGTDLDMADLLAIAEGQAVAAQARNEGLGVPMPERDQRFQPLAAHGAPALARHVGFGPGLVNEYKPSRLLSHALLPLGRPLCARCLYVRTQRFAGQRGFFYS